MPTPQKLCVQLFQTVFPFDPPIMSVSSSSLTPSRATVLATIGVATIAAVVTWKRYTQQQKTKQKQDEPPGNTTGDRTEWVGPDPPPVARCLGGLRTPDSELGGWLVCSGFVMPDGMRQWDVMCHSTCAYFC